MGNIWRLLERGFTAGAVIAAACAGFAVFFYLLYRLTRLAHPKAARLKERRVTSHRLYKVPGRGRIAYLTLCLKEALQFYGQDFGEWGWLLCRMWSVTDLSENNWIDIWLDSVGQLLPSEILTDGTAETASAVALKARALYTRAGTAMIVISAIIENAYRIAGGWSPGMDVHDPDAISLIAEAEETMTAFGVPLPSDETVRPILARKDLPLGKPFDIPRPF